VTVAAAPARSPTPGVRTDPTFGGGRGFVTTPITGSSLAYAAIVLRGGAIVVAGQAFPQSGNGQVVVARYRSDGRLDRTFGRGGTFQSAFPAASGPFLADAIAQDRRTGKLIIAGGYGQGSMLVMRLNARGQLDRTFAAHRGFATVSVGGIANSLAIQRDGRILLGGYNANPEGRPFVVARFTRGGILDRTFGRRGIAQLIFWNRKAAAGGGLTGLATTADGGLIASGHIDYIGGHGGQNPGHGTAGIFRLNRSGLPIRRFGTRGHVEVTFFNRAHMPLQWFPCAMTTDRRGRITVTGGGAASALLTARLTGGGALDRSYGSNRNGRSVMPGAGGNAITTCGAAATPAGALTAGVQSTLAQLLSNGRPNTRFARRGVFTIVRPRGVFINAVLRSGPQRIVLAGSAGNAMYVARYLLPPGG